MKVSGEATRVRTGEQSEPLACEVKGADLERVRRGRAGLLPERSYSLLAATFRSLADPTRARILHSLL